MQGIVNKICCKFISIWSLYGTMGNIIIINIINQTFTNLYIVHHEVPLNLDILQGSFRLCKWLSLRRLVSWINHLPPVCIDF